MATDGRIEAVIGKAKVFHVHQLEPHWETGRGLALRQLDHPGGQVDSDYRAARGNGDGEGVAERSGATGQVEDPLAGCGIEPVDCGGPPMSFASGHDLVEASFIGGRNAAEGARVKVLGGWLFQIKRAGAQLPPLRIISR